MPQVWSGKPRNVVGMVRLGNLKLHEGPGPERCPVRSEQLPLPLIGPGNARCDEIHRDLDFAAGRDGLSNREAARAAQPISAKEDKPIRGIPAAGPRVLEPPGLGKKRIRSDLQSNGPGPLRHEDRLIAAGLRQGREPLPPLARPDARSIPLAEVEIVWVARR